MSHKLQNWSLPSHYTHLLETLGSAHPLRRTGLPLDDSAPAPGELEDPLAEEKHTSCHGFIHTYPDKVLLLATLDCAVHCQYCTRGRLIKKNHTFKGMIFPEASKPWKLSDQVFQTLEKLTEVRDVLISGGDPLTLSDEVARALGALADAGVPMVSQTVLLKGINDEADTLADLFYGLLENRVKPYYLFQCDPVLGSSSFRTPVQRGLALMKELQGRVSGLALPNFCIDAPGGGGKIVLHPDTVLRRDGDDILLTNYPGKEYRYTEIAE